MYTAIIIDIEPPTGIENLKEMIQTTFAKRGITITHFHDTIYVPKYNLAHIKFNFYIESYNSTDINQHRYADRMLYRLHKYADEEAAYNSQDKHKRGDFTPSIEPFEMVYITIPKKSWEVKLVRPTVY